jgi:hypothetical protein
MESDGKAKGMIRVSFVSFLFSARIVENFTEELGLVIPFWGRMNRHSKKIIMVEKGRVFFTRNLYGKRILNLGYRF